MPQSPSHVFVPSLDAQYADLGLPPLAYQVTAWSQDPGGALHVQVFTGAGYLWLKPADYRPAAEPAKCFVCGWSQSDHSTSGSHQFWSEADAAAEAAAQPSGSELSPSASESHNPADWNYA
jgi:hypothetical protein